MSSRLGDDIASCVLNCYETTCPTKFRDPTSAAWTVLSGIVKEEEEGNLQCIVWATGTKCVGKNQLLVDDYFVLHDSHAEVLCKRGLQRYLSSRKKSDYNNCKFHMYISEAPCGDASIYPIVATDITTTNSLRVTGAKTVGTFEFQSTAIGNIRTKSSRSNIPESHRTQSVSCTDKIRKWMTRGIPIMLSKTNAGVSSVVISNDPNAESIEEFHGAISRGVGCTSDCKILVSEKQFSQSRWVKESANPLDISVNWIINESYEVTNKFGRKQGSNRKLPPSLKTASRLSRAKLVADFTKDEKIIDGATYRKEKRRRKE